MTAASRVIILLTILAAVIFLNPDHPFYLRAFTTWPTLFVMFWLADKYYDCNKNITKLLLISTSFLIGTSIIHANLRSPIFSFYELWWWYILDFQFIGILLFLDWVKAVISLYIISLVYFILWNWYYESIPFTLYITFLNIWVFYPIVWLFISQKFKEMIYLLKTKKDLINTIQTILKVLPEGVIIRVMDPLTKEIITKYANDYAQKFVKENNEEITLSNNVNIKYRDNNLIANIESNEWSLDNFLKHQEAKIDEILDDNYSQIVEIKNTSDLFEDSKEFIRDKNDQCNQEEKVYFYNIKSIKVKWESKEAFMHLFVNITQIKKLEEERANRKWQQIMFTSLSHDMRTPLNTFSNSLQLIRIWLNELKSKFANYSAINDSYNALEPRIDKYF